MERVVGYHTNVPSSETGDSRENECEIKNHFYVCVCVCVCVYVCVNECFIGPLSLPYGFREYSCQQRSRSSVTSSRANRFRQPIECRPTDSPPTSEWAWPTRRLVPFVSIVLFVCLFVFFRGITCSLPPPSFRVSNTRRRLFSHSSALFDVAVDVHRLS